jgi:hypothetical protein
MKQSKKKRLLGGLALAAGAVGAASAYFIQKNGRTKRSRASRHVSVWARPSMLVTFRAELMPGRERDERTFRVKELLPSGRVLLHGVSGEHAEKEFEAVH